MLILKDFIASTKVSVNFLCVLQLYRVIENSYGQISINFARFTLVTCKPERAGCIDFSFAIGIVNCSFLTLTVSCC